MIICLGPVCCPLWPVLFLVVQPLWLILPQSTKDKITVFWSENVMPYLNPILDKIPPKIRKFLFFGTSCAKAKNEDAPGAKSCCSGGSCEMKKMDGCSTSDNCSTKTVSSEVSTAALSAANQCLKSGSLLHFDDEAEFHAVIQNLPADVTVFIDYTAPWCKPCQKIKPTYTELAKKNAAGAVFCVVDIDELDDLAIEQNVAAIPAIHCWKGGKFVGKLGMVSEEKLERFVGENVGA